MEEAKIPVFSVLKKGTTLKNIFLNSPPPETGKPLSPSRDNDSILMGRHPDCHIIVDHPSISRFHLEVRSKSSLQKLFVTDRSSVHGTWVSGKKIQPNTPIELIEGDTIRLGASTRIYRLHWMPLSHAFEMDKPMSPLIEEPSDFGDNDVVLQDENFNETWASNIMPSAPPMRVSSPGKLISQDLEKGGEILIKEEKFEQSLCFSSIVPWLETVSSSWPLKDEIGASKNILANEMQPEREEPNTLRSDNTAKSSSLLLRRNKSISFLQIEKMSQDNGSEIRKSKEDLEIEEQISGAFAGGNGEEKIPFVLLAKDNVKEEEEEMCASDEEKLTLVNSIGSNVLKSNGEMNKSLMRSFKISNKDDLKIEEKEFGTLTIENGMEKNTAVFLDEVHLKEEEGTFASDKESMTPVNSLGSNLPRSIRGIDTSPLSSLSTFDLEVPSNSDKAISNATEQFKSNKLRSRSRLMKENGDSKLSDSKTLESLITPGVKLQRSLFKPERSPLGENALKVEEDKENWTPQVPKSLMSGKTFARDLLKAESEGDETFTSDKENLTPQSSMLIKSKKALSQSHGKKEGETMRRKERVPFQPLFVSSPLRNSSPSSYVEGLDDTFGNNCVNNVHNLDEKAPHSKDMEELSRMPGRETKKWYIVVDVGCFLTEESRKSLQLLEGIRGTQLIIPRIVIRELDHLKRCQGILSRGVKASSVLQWIEESMMKTSWWIHVQNSSETFPTAPTPPATPRSQLCDGSSGFGTATSSYLTGFSTCGSLMEIVSPTAEDHILDCALLFKRIKDDGQLMLLTSSTTLRIKAMAEGLLCETPKEFRESLVNPFSKRFLWADSSPRGSTWSCLEEVGLPENCYQQFAPARIPKAEGTVKGLKLILLPLIVE